MVRLENRHTHFSRQPQTTKIQLTIRILSPNRAATMPLSATNILSHALNAGIMFLDLLIVAYPLRLYHVIQPIIFGLSFGFFSFIYYLCDGKNMYVFHCEFMSESQINSIFFVAEWVIRTFTMYWIGRNRIRP